MSKITEYSILTARSPNELVALVNGKINDGWVPTGGVFITQGPPIQSGQNIITETYSHQSMVKLDIW